MANGYVTSGLSSYVEVNKDVLLKNLILGSEAGDTIPKLRHQLNIKSKERLNYLDVDPIFQDGTGCGFSASGSTVLTERDIEVSPIKINDQYCNDDLVGKFAEYMVKYGANSNAEDGFGFEREILSELARKTNLKMEKLAWQGDKTGNGDLIDGFLTQALGADSASTIAVSYTAATSAISLYDAVKAVIMKIPEEMLDKAVVFLSPAIFRSLCFELTEKNMYHFPSDKVGAEIEDADIIFPGTNVRVHKTYGLSGDKKHIYCSAYENMVYGTDLMNDQEEMRVWFSDDDDVYKLKVKWVAGVKTLYPDAVVVLTSTNNLVA